MSVDKDRVGVTFTKPDLDILTRLVKAGVRLLITKHEKLLRFLETEVI